MEIKSTTKLEMKASIVMMLIALLSTFFATDCFAQKFTGKASYYGSQFHGRKSASGSVYDMYKFTCAHKTLPFGTKLKVTNTKNGKSAIVEVTDRGPYAKGRIIDVSKAAAVQLGMVSAGVVPVSIEVIQEESTAKSNQIIISEPDMNNEFKKMVPRIAKTPEHMQALR